MSKSKYDCRLVHFADEILDRYIVTYPKITSPIILTFDDGNIILKASPMFYNAKIEFVDKLSSSTKFTLVEVSSSRVTSGNVRVS